MSKNSSQWEGYENIKQGGPRQKEQQIQKLWGGSKLGGAQEMQRETEFEEEWRGRWGYEVGRV